MKIEIVTNNDENFSLITENSIEVQPQPPVKKEEEVVETPQPLPPQNSCPPPPRGAPLYNPTQTNSFDLFSGTSWEGKKQW